MKYYKNSIEKRKEYIANICKEHKTWKLRMGLFYFFILLSIFDIMFFTVLIIIYIKNFLGVLALLGSGTIFFIIPFFTAITVRNMARFSCSYPYSSFANGNLILYEDRLEFIYWRVGRYDPGAYSMERQIYLDEDRYIYTIPISNIKELNIDKNHICHIKGDGIISEPEFLSYEDKRKEVKAKKFAFLLDFEDTSVEDEIVRWWNEREENSKVKI